MARYRKIGTRRIDPRGIRVTVRSEAAVRGYMENPDWSGPDFFGNGGTPAVMRNADGSEVAGLGNHRIAAAQRTGRKIKAEIWVERGASENKPKGFLDWLFS